MKKAIRKILAFLLCWILWIMPAIKDLKESGFEYGGITCLFLSLATNALILPFIFSGIHLLVVTEINPNIPLVIFDFLPFTFPVGLSIYLIAGIIYHLTVKEYGGASWYVIYKNIS
ncbi:MAG: hypothetical protein AAB596_01055 [Patescibacteria group bacterium]